MAISNKKHPLPEKIKGVIFTSYRLGKDLQCAGTYSNCPFLNRTYPITLTGLMVEMHTHLSILASRLAKDL